MLFLDANIILEILFKREKSEFCINICKEYESLAISPTSLHIIYYYAEKAKIDLEFLEEMLEDFVILPFNSNDFKLALDVFENEDMEDALQIATAINNDIKQVFSLDSKMVQKYQNLVKFVG